MTIREYCERERDRFRGQTFPNKRAEVRLAEIAVIAAAKMYECANNEGQSIEAATYLVKTVAALERSLNATSSR